MSYMEIWPRKYNEKLKKKEREVQRSLLSFLSYSASTNFINVKKEENAFLHALSTLNRKTYRKQHMTYSIPGDEKIGPGIST